MDETVEKVVLEQASDFSLLSLFLDADIVVKLVILILLLSSIWSWAIIFSKYTHLKGILIDTEDFEGESEVLKKYTIDLTKLAEEGKLDPVIGRDSEIRRAIQVLQRRTKNNLR